MDRAEWLEWRRGGLGASDAPIIMGVSPYRDILSLYNEKVFGAKEYTNKAIERGNALEPIARAMLEEKYGMGLQPKNLDNGEVWRASLDAVSDDGTLVFEIKSPTNPKTHLEAKRGLVPSQYYPQLQHQLMLEPRASSVTYVSYLLSEEDFESGFLSKGELVFVECPRDEEYIKRLKKEELAFWELVKNKTPPEGKERLVVDRGDEARWKELAFRMKELDGSLASLESERELHRKEMIEISGDADSIGCGYTVTRISKKGRLDYKTAYCVLKKEALKAGLTPPDEKEYTSEPCIEVRLSSY